MESRIELISFLSRLFLLSALLLIIPNGCSNVIEIKEKESILDYSYSGSKELGLDFRNIMKHPEVQQLFLAIAESPRSAEYIDDALKDIDISVSNLVNLKLIRPVGDQFELSFVLYTREDMDLIREVAEEMGKYLADGILERRAEIEKLVKSDIPSGVDWRETAFFLIGCVSLDWDGLRISRNNGFLTQPAMDEYLPLAIQPGGGGSNKELYWGSHNHHSQIAITSFGDHAVVRQILPDINWRMEVDAPDPLDRSLISAASGLIRLGVGRTMIALREADLNISELSFKTGLPEDDLERIVKFLLDIEYIVEVESKYRAIITVLSEQDRESVNQLRQIGQNVILEWFDDYYSELDQRLSELTPVQYGVPLADGFYWVWHYVFGIANRELVKSGLFIDPYHPDRRYQGSIPAVYLYDVVTDQL